MPQILDWTTLEVWHARASADPYLILRVLLNISHVCRKQAAVLGDNRALRATTKAGRYAGLSMCALRCRHSLWPAHADSPCVLQGMKAARLLGSKPAGKAPRSAPGMQASMMMYPGTVIAMQIKHH